MKAPAIEGHMPLRYEDVAQDGRVRVEGLFASLAVVWRQTLGDERASEHSRILRDQGVIPILSRLEAEGTDGPFAVEHGIDVHGLSELTHVRSPGGAVERILFDLHSEISAPKGRTNLPPPDDAGTRSSVGRVFAEHVFTRPFAAPEDRKVLSLAIPGVPEVPGAPRVWLPPKEAGDVPQGAALLDEAAIVDPVAIVFGLMHTDSNQHVNSMVYPRLFEEVCLRRFVVLGRSPAILLRKITLGFRRPSFAGETVRVAVQAFQHEGRLGAVCSVFGEGEEKARVYGRLFFE